MKKMIFFVNLVMILGLTACNANFGDSIIRDQVQVYYLKPITFKEAVQLADYWEEKQLSSEKIQFLQLSEIEGVKILKLITNDSTFLKEIPFEVQLELFNLDSMLANDLFPNQEFELHISDKVFAKTKKIN